MMNYLPKICAVLVAFSVYSLSLSAQVATNSGSGLAPTYPTLFDAIAAVNAATITSPVVIQLSAAETAPAGGYVITAEGTAVNTITIDGFNNIIMAFTPQTAGLRADAIFKLVGADYITLQNFIMQENPANVVTALASNTKTEFGVGLFYATTTNGATNNTIQNNTITLDRNYPNSFGVYSSTRHSLLNANGDATATGRNINNKIYANDISNVNYGICFVSPPAAPARETGNDIGGNTPATGNRITNWGSSTAITASYSGVSGTILSCIYFNHQDDYNIANNLVQSAGSIAPSIITGVFVNNSNGATTATATNTISNNSITLINTNTGGTQFSAIRLGSTLALTNTTFNVNGNTILNCASTGASSTMLIKLIDSEVAAKAVNITNNTFLNNTCSTVGVAINAIETSTTISEQLRINGNVFGSTTQAPIVLTANMTAVTTLINNSSDVTSGRIEMNNNIFYGIKNNNNASTGAHTYISNVGKSGLQTINANQFTSITATQASAVNLISFAAVLAAGAQQEVKDNSIVGSFTKTNTTGSLNIYSSSTTSAITSVMTHTGNNFSNINFAGGVINGWNCIDASTTNIKNINNNTFENWAGLTIKGIVVARCGAGSTINNNVINNITATGVLTAMEHSGVAGDHVYNGNTITNLSGTTTTAMNIATTSAVFISISNNTIRQMVGSLAATQAIFTSSVASGRMDINNNNITGISSSANGTTVRVLYVGGAGVANIFENSISQIGSTASTTANIYGVQIIGGATVRITNNKLFDFASNTAFTNTLCIVGLYLNSTAPNYFIANNRISKFYAPNANNAQAIYGIHYPAVGATKRLDILYNTIYLDGTSSATNFGTACINLVPNATATSGEVFMNNNIFVNIGTRKGGGAMAAIQRVSSTYANYNASSNNNLLYVNPMLGHLICYGIAPTDYETLVDFQTAIAPRESNSVSALPLFLSLDGNNANYLHLAPEGNCQIEGKGMFMASVTTDIDAEIRNATTPDIGADEFVGLPFVTTANGPAAICIGQTADLTTAAITTGTSNNTIFSYWQDATATTTLTNPSTVAAGTYYIKYNLGNCEDILAITIGSTGNTASTIATIDATAPIICPNTTVILNASGGTAGTGSNIYWYSAANGGGTLLGSGSSITVTPTTTTTYYARREGSCNTTADDSKTIAIRDFIYAANNTTANTFCTDANGWHHFYNGAQIILSLQGDLSGISAMTAKIGDNGAYYSSTGAPANCATAINPGLARFEMARNWNIDYTGVLAGTYNVRFYYQPSERTDVEMAAANWLAAYPLCSYVYKYNAGANGWYWFKNTSGAYPAPQYNGLQLTHNGTGSAGGTNYIELTNVSSFSGGSGAITLESPFTLPITLLDFSGHHADKANLLYWTTATENNNQYFELQRSADGANNFENIAQIASKGNSQANQYYQHSDNNPLIGTNYYRLRQVDIDGSSIYSHIIAINANTTAQTAKFSPNPASTQVTYQHFSDKAATFSVRIYNTLGQLVDIQQFEAQIGYNRQQISLENLPAGAYQLNVQHANAQTTTIIIKE